VKEYNAEHKLLEAALMYATEEILGEIARKRNGINLLVDDDGKFELDGTIPLGVGNIVVRSSLEEVLTLPLLDCRPDEVEGRKNNLVKTLRGLADKIEKRFYRERA
jgi:hypothetical protein